MSGDNSELIYNYTNEKGLKCDIPLTQEYGDELFCKYNKNEIVITGSTEHLLYVCNLSDGK